MKNENKNYRKHYEILVQNAQKGEIYLLKLKDSQLVYVTIPVLRDRFTTEAEDVFSFRILQPEENKGIFQRSIEDIELLEKYEQ